MKLIAVIPYTVRSIMIRSGLTSLIIITIAVAVASAVAISSTAVATADGVIETVRTLTADGILVSPDPYMHVRELTAADLEVVRRAVGARSSEVRAIKSTPLLLTTPKGSIRVRASNMVSAAGPAAGAGLIITPFVAERLFAGSAAGQPVTLRGKRVSRISIVAGVEDVGVSVLFGTRDVRTARLPLALLDELAPGPINAIEILPTPNSSTADIERQALRALNAAHPGAFVATDPTEANRLLQSDIAVVQISLFGGAFASLCAAGISLTNILLMSIADRRKEIAIRRAVGAATTDILVLFVLEAGVYALAGTAIGLLLGIGIAEISRGYVLQYVPIKPISLAVVLFTAAACGTFLTLSAGALPAWLAARQEPLEALTRP
jgi:ABC-type antimicrobial peptide transport system permease subunit